MLKKTTILHIASGDLWAGAEAQLFTLCKALNKHDHLEVIVILLNHGTLETKLIENNIKTFIFNETKHNGFSIFLSIVKQIRRNQPSIIHTHRFKENILGGIAGLLTSTPGIRTVHGATEFSHKWYRLDKILLNRLDIWVGKYLQKNIIAVSEDLAEKLKPLYDNRITTIPNGIDLNILHTIEDNISASKDKLIFNIGIVGRLTNVKRIDIFLRTALISIQAIPDKQLNFHIYGDGPLRNELEELSYKLGLEKSVIFHGHSQKIHQKISELDILMITSDHEGLPMTLLEAMYLQTPVISHGVGGIPDACMNDTYCWICQDNSAETMSSKLVECINNYSIAVEKSAQAAQRVKQNFSAEKNSQQIENLYKQILL